MPTRLFAAALLLLVQILPAAQAGAVTAGCLAMAEAEPVVRPAAFAATALEADQVKLTYIGHSSFIIESPGGTRIVTDYSGYAGGIVPDVVTMNRAHTTHYTDFPDPAIRHVLRGWNPEGGPAQHDSVIGDVRIRNVTTDIRGGQAGRIPDGNSVFIFEVAGLCLVHLGHLHHELGAGHLGAIGRTDIVMVPVDGGYTMAQANMLEVLKALKARIVIPMHAFGPVTLNRFVVTVGAAFRLESSSSPERIFSAADLAEEPRLLVLPGS